MIENVSPTDTWAALVQNPQAQLVDVRTPAEWHFVGLPDLTPIGRTVHVVSWQSINGQRNADFLTEMENAGLAAGMPLYFICRSGARSHAAAVAASAAGYGAVYNVADGFEGPLDADGHRGHAAGWKADNLPWQQS